MTCAHCGKQLELHISPNGWTIWRSRNQYGTNFMPCNLRPSTTTSGASVGFHEPEWSQNVI